MERLSNLRNPQNKPQLVGLKGPIEDFEIVYVLHWSGHKQFFGNRFTWVVAKLLGALLGASGRCSAGLDKFEVSTTLVKDLAICDSEVGLCIWKPFP